MGTQRIRSAVCSLLAACLVLASSACNKQPAAPPATLPPNWPIPELTLPPDATAFVLPWEEGDAAVLWGYYEEDLILPGDVRGEEWSAIFQSQLSIDEVFGHFEGQLKRLGYLSETVPQEDANVAKRYYCTPNGLTAISVLCTVDPQPGANTAKDGWSLIVMELDKPMESWSPANCQPIK